MKKKKCDCHLHKHQVCDVCQEITGKEKDIKSPDPLTFDRLREVNVARCEEVFHPIYDWSSTDWACAMGGECGEALNKIKKIRRGELIPIKQVAYELADLVIYADLLAERLSINLGEAIREKFNKVSKKKKSKYRL